MKIFIPLIIMVIFCTSTVRSKEVCKSIKAYSANWRGVSEFGKNLPLQGVAVDALRNMLSKQDKPFSVRPKKIWPRLLIALKRGDIDMIGGIYKTSDRLKEISFIGPIHRIPVHIYTNKKNAKFIKSKKDLKGKITLKSSHSSLGEDIEDFLNKNSTLLEITSYDFHITKMLVKERIDFFVGTQENTRNDIKIAGLENEIIELKEPIGYNLVYLGLSKKSPCYAHIIRKSIYPVIE